MNKKEIIEWVNQDDTLLFYNEKQGIVDNYEVADCILEVADDNKFYEYNMEGNIVNNNRKEDSVISWW